jgi:probable rRNA maturation factor
MEDPLSQVEFTIELDHEDEESSLTHMIASLPLESVVFQTLSLAGIKQPVLVALLITNDEAIHALNKQYRNQDQPTDVLSFPLLEQPTVEAPSEQLWSAPNLDEDGDIHTKQAFVTPPDSVLQLGDIVISWPTVQRQALEVRHDPAYELLFLVSHGVLHLVGYDDQTEAGYQAMMSIQLAVMEASGQKV